MKKRAPNLDLKIPFTGTQKFWASLTGGTGKTWNIVLGLFLLSATTSAQSSNDPQTVFPMVEQFIAEAHQAGIPTYHKIRQIDSIAVNKLPYPLTGLYLKGATYESITIHQDMTRTRRSIEKSFYHEIGESFGLRHSHRPREIMNTMPNDPWFENDTNWKKAKAEFFKQLKSPQP